MKNRQPKLLMQPVRTTLLITLITTMTLQAEKTPFFIGTYTKGTSSEGIYAGWIESQTGALGGIHLAAEAGNPSFLALSPRKNFLYAVMEGDEGMVGAFALTPAGKLTPLNARPSGGGAPCHVTVTPSGRHVFVANYSGGSMACFRVEADGSLGEASDRKQFEGSGPHPTRQKKSHAHSVLVDSSERFLYVCDLGADKVWSFHFDPERGLLTPCRSPAGTVPPGGGPRHFVTSPCGHFAYTNNEMGLTITAFRRAPETGTLTEFQTVPSSPPGLGPVDGVTTSALVLHPGGRFLYISTRGDNTLSTFAIAADGSLQHIQTIPSTVDTPRGMALDPSGRWLVVAGQKDNRLVSFALNPENGQLSPTGSEVAVPTPVCITFQPNSHAGSRVRKEQSGGVADSPKPQVDSGENFR